LQTAVLFPPGANPELDTAIVIGETDYTSYAVMFYQKQGKVTVKLYSKFPSHVYVRLPGGVTANFESFWG